VIDWRTSSGKAGRLTLDWQIAPGTRQYIPSVFFYQYGVDDGATCTAIVVSHPPIAATGYTELRKLGTQSGSAAALGAAGAIQQPIDATAVPLQHQDTSGLDVIQQDSFKSAKTKTVLLTPATGQPTTPQPATTPATPGSSRFEPPRGPHGLTLYACQTLGSNDCGRSVAQAFCQANGWTGAGTFDTDKKKVQAETLSGETCSKKKCQVFNAIVCIR
jgi:hypothetical protein